MTIVKCYACSTLGIETMHRLPVGAVKSILIRAQEGELNTVRGNTVCLLTLIGDEKD